MLATRIADLWEAEQDSLMRLIQRVMSLQALCTNAPSAPRFLLDITLFLGDCKLRRQHSRAMLTSPQ